MTVITIQANDAYGNKLFQKLKADKNLRVTIEQPASETRKSMLEIEATLPGKPLSHADLLMLLSMASRGKAIPVNEARKKTAAKLALWRKGR